MANENVKRAAFSSTCSLSKTRIKQLIGTRVQPQCSSSRTYVISLGIDISFQYLMVFLLQGSLVLWVQGRRTADFG